MTLTAEQLDALDRLAEAATPGPWLRRTVGHANLTDIAAAVTRSVGMGEWPSTDATWIESGADGEGPHVAFVGNGPRQTENGDLIANLDPATVKELVSMARGPEPQREPGAASLDVERLAAALCKSNVGHYRGWDAAESHATVEPSHREDAEYIAMIYALREPSAGETDPTTETGL